MRQQLITLLFTLFISAPCYLQVSLNEYSASNLRDFQDQFSKYEDWIELYNNSNEAIDISGYYLSDRENNPTKWQIPVGTTIENKGYLVFYTSGRDKANHTNFKLSQTDDKEVIVLSDASGNLVEKIKLGKTQLSHSRGKLNNGSLWKVFTNPTPGESNENAAWYNGYAPNSTILKNAGFYQNKVVAQATTENNFTLRYTLDGSQPNENSPIFSDSISINKTAVLKVRNFSNDTLILPGFIDFRTYFIDEPTSTLPIFSVASEEAIALAEGDRELQPISSIECFDKDGNVYAISYGELDSHGQDSWVNDQRSLDWISRDEMGYSNGIKAKLFHSSDRDNFQRIIFRASGDDNYPAVQDADHEGSTHVRDEYVQTLAENGNMNMDLRSVERCILYLNGKYWGVYTIREKPDDHDYTNYRYDQDKYDVQFLKTWGTTWSEYGEEKALEDWIELRDFILENDMSDENNYNQVLEQYDALSIIDYMITNLSVVSSDWMNYNVGWWRGLNPEGEHKKWGYILWDNDATFDYYINYSGVPNTNADAKACDIEDISNYMDEFFPADTTTISYPADSFFWDGEWIYYPGDTFDIYPDPGKHEKIFLKLLEESPYFRNLYFSRYADHINEVFSCENMNHVLDSLLAIIEPEMPRHIGRWGRDIDEWMENVEKLRDYVNERCSLIDDGMVDCYEVTGPHQLTVVSQPAIPFKIDINTLVNVSGPYATNYFGNMKNSITTYDTANYEFVRWESKSGNVVIENTENAFTNFEISNSDTLVAVFRDLVGVKDVYHNDLIIYPNPTAHFITAMVDESYVSYNIYDIAGKKVKPSTAAKTTDRITLDVSLLQSGMYTIEIIGKDKISTNKFSIIK